jgi:hypothetical protein
MRTGSKQYMFEVKHGLEAFNSRPYQSKERKRKDG